MLYSLVLFGKVQPYSSKKLAEQNACRFLIRHTEYALGEYTQEFRDLYNRENYQGAIDLWNKQVVPFYYNNNSLYAVLIGETIVDADFI